LINNNNYTTISEIDSFQVYLNLTENCCYMQILVRQHDRNCVFYFVYLSRFIFLLLSSHKITGGFYSPCSLLILSTRANRFRNVYGMRIEMTSDYQTVLHSIQYSLCCNVCAKHDRALSRESSCIVVHVSVVNS